MAKKQGTENVDVVELVKVSMKEANAAKKSLAVCLGHLRNATKFATFGEDVVAGKMREVIADSLSEATLAYVEASTHMESAVENFSKLPE